MDNGWIKLHRKVLDNPIANKANFLALWVTLLLLANHKDTKFMWNGEVIIVGSGQLLTGRKQLSEQSGIPESTIEDILKFLENQHQIRQQKTTKYRVITIVNWKEYQKSDSDSDNKATTKQQQSDTYKNVKNVKNEKNITICDETSHVNEIISLFKEVNPSYARLYANRTQRSAIERVLKTIDREKLCQAIRLLPRTNKMQYAPVITTPLQLEEKLAVLISFLQKQKDKKINFIEI